jgi:hypothetical protein
MMKLKLKFVGDVTTTDTNPERFYGKLAGDGDQAKQIDFYTYISKDGDTYKLEHTIQQAKQLNDLGIEPEIDNVLQLESFIISKYKKYLEDKSAKQVEQRTKEYDTSALHILLKEIKRLPTFKDAVLSATKEEYIKANNNGSLYIKVYNNVYVHIVSVYAPTYSKCPIGWKYHLEADYETVTKAEKVTTIIKKLQEWYDNKAYAEQRAQAKAADEKEMLEKMNKIFGKVTREQHWHQDHRSRGYSTPYYKIHIDATHSFNIVCAGADDANREMLYGVDGNCGYAKFTAEQIKAIIDIVAEGK